MNSWILCWQEVVPAACENMQYLKGQPNEQLDPVLAGGGGDGLEEETVREDRLCGSGGSGCQEAC
jgi:hypothetical protein